MLKSHNSPPKAIKRFVSSAPDLRFEELQQWVLRFLGVSAATFTRASEDASFRRYFRVHVEERSWIVMDAPPEREDCYPFI